jgi:hypothetical protein
MNGLFLSLLALISCAGCTISRTFFTTPDCDTNVSRLSKWAEHSASENGTIRVLRAWDEQSSIRLERWQT